jgi:hypothetical protein
MEDLSKMSKEDRARWTEFRSNTSSKLRKGEYDMICELHAKYYKHSFYKPCTCSPRTVNKWVAQLNDIYEREV